MLLIGQNVKITNKKNMDAGLFYSSMGEIIDVASRPENTILPTAKCFQSPFIYWLTGVPGLQKDCFYRIYGKTGLWQDICEHLKHEVLFLNYDHYDLEVRPEDYPEYLIRFDLWLLQSACISAGG